jgi:hypothetical protein
MEELMQALRDLFAREFPGSAAELEQVRPLQKVGGFLIWEGFEGQEQLERQRAVSRAIRQLDPGAQLQLSTILTVTPEEIAVMREG